MSRAGAWAFVSGTATLAAANSAMNFIAAADLGYEATERGKLILRVWGYTAMGLLVLAIAAGGIAWKFRGRPNSRSQAGRTAP
jgi:hypothetical protein